MTAKDFILGRLLPWVTAVLAALLAALLAYFSPVSNSNSDPQFGLLVSQAMLRYQTLRMDVYEEALAPILSRAFVILDGHIYYYFPLGTPIFSMPFVGAANLLGYDMADALQEEAAQNFLSAVLVGLSFLVIYRTGRVFLPGGTALLLSAAAFLGSALISTMATALWSIDFAVLFVALSLLVLSKEAAGEERPSHPYLLGFFLFGAYLCRPSTFLFVALVLGYLLVVDRKMFWRTAVFAFGLLAAFLILIRLGYGSWLPPYYNDFGRLTVERRPLYEAFFGNLVSPSRGLFVYSPFFLLTLAGALFYFHRLKRRPLYWLMLVWLVLHLVLVARTTRWWGGLSFGPRILTELLPGLALLTALVTAVFLERAGPKRRAAVGVLFAGLAAWAVFLNSYQGLFNRYTAWWHSALTPNVDYEPDYLWRWDYAQFRADNEALCRRDQEYIASVLAAERLAREMYPYELGRPLEIVSEEPELLYEVLGRLKEEEPFGQDGAGTASAADVEGVYLPAVVHEGEDNLAVVLSGWSPSQAGYRWSMCRTAAIAFKGEAMADADQSYLLTLQSGSFGRQRVNVRLNGVDLGQVVFDGGATPAVSHSLAVPAGVLRPGEINQLVFDLPDSMIPEGLDEERRVGLAFVSFIIKLAED